MQGVITKDGRVTITWNLTGAGEKLYSPDGSQHCLPCESCGAPQWAGVKSNAVLCPACATDLAEDLAPFGPAIAAGEISEAEAIIGLLAQLRKRSTI